MHLEKLIKLFVIRVNLFHPQPSWFLYGLFSLKCWSILVHYYFQVSFNFKVIWYRGKITQNNTTVFLEITESSESNANTECNPANTVYVAPDLIVLKTKVLYNVLLHESNSFHFIIWIKFCAVIGYLSGQDGATFPTRD